MRVGERIARLVVRVASVLVPGRLRRDWVEEWHAELWHEARRAGGRPLKAVRGAFVDAVAARALVDSAGADGLGRRRIAPALGAETRIALRGLRRAPGFSAIALFTLSLGIGATAALFAVLDAVVLEPLPYVEADRLVTVSHPVPGYSTDGNWPVSQAGFFEFREQATTLESLGVYAVNAVNLADEGAPPTRLDGAYISAGLFDVLRATAVVGRLFGEADDVPGAPRVAVLSYGLWRTRYGGDPGVVGQTIRLNGNALEIVGVTPPGFHLPDVPVDIWLPFQLDPSAPAVNSHWLAAVGRLRAGVSGPEAQAELLGLTGRFPELFPQAYSPDFMRQFGFSTEVRPLCDEVLGDVARVLWTLFGAVGLLLLIAAANVANLFLVRAESKRREVSVRAALGASRAALARTWYVESALLAGAAAVAGLALAWAVLRGVVLLAPASLPRLEAIRMDASAVVFAFAVAVAATALFGSICMLRFRADRAFESVHESGRRTTAGKSTHRARHVMVAAQVALALVLLTGAGLLLRSFASLTRVDPGFEPDQLLVFDVGLPVQPYELNSQAVAFYDGLLARIRALPGVVAAGATTQLALDGQGGCFAAMTEVGRPADTRPACIPTAFVTPGWFEAMGIPVSGRSLEAQDVASGSGPALVTRSLAERLWPGRDPLGQGIKPFQDGPPFYRVVGVTADIRAAGLEKPVVDFVYYPMKPIPGEPAALVRNATVTVRTTRADVLSLLPELRGAMAAVDPQIPIGDARTMRHVVARSMNRLSFALLLIGVSAGVALVLGAVGLYGVIAWVVGQRRAEIGVRMALGARTARVGLHVVRQAFLLGLAGVAAGMLVTRVTLPLLAGTALLYDVGASDPLTLAGVSLLLLAVAVLASWIPAWRAASVDPAEALRAD